MDYFIVGLVSLVAIAAHVWIFLWVRFRILEGVICNYLETAEATNAAQARPLSTIASANDLSLPRVHSLCQRSARISTSDDSAWLEAR